MCGGGLGCADGEGEGATKGWRPRWWEQCDGEEVPFGVASCRSEPLARRRQSFGGAEYRLMGLTEQTNTKVSIIGLERQGYSGHVA
ncbi:hypothetical protein GYH30_039599 [Glycine max]|nr:hypothetical protein GYH30_039599 [Glycine max]